MTVAELKHAQFLYDTCYYAGVFFLSFVFVIGTVALGHYFNGKDRNNGH